MPSQPLLSVVQWRRQKWASHQSSTALTPHQADLRGHLPKLLAIGTIKHLTNSHRRYSGGIFKASKIPLPFCVNQTIDTILCFVNWVEDVAIPETPLGGSCCRLTRVAG